MLTSYEATSYSKNKHSNDIFTANKFYFQFSVSTWIYFFHWTNRTWIEIFAKAEWRTSSIASRISIENQRHVCFNDGGIVNEYCCGIHGAICGATRSISDRIVREKIEIKIAQTRIVYWKKFIFVLAIRVENADQIDHWWSFDWFESWSIMICIQFSGKKNCDSNSFLNENRCRNYVRRIV